MDIKGKMKYDEEDAALDAMLIKANQFLDRPAVAYKKLMRARERYDDAYSRVTRTGIDYSSAGKLGCRVQVSPHNSFEDGMINLTEKTQMLDNCKLLYSCEWLTVFHAMRQAGLTYNQRKVLTGRISPRQKTYEQIAKELELKSKQQANYLYTTGMAKFVSGYVDKYYNR